MRIKLTALALAAILPLASAQAAGNGKSSYTKWQKNDQHWMQELGLDDKQRLQFQEKRNAYRAEQHKQRQEMNRQRKQRSDTYRREMQARHERHHNELRNLLNPEQRMAFDRYQQTMKAAGKQRKQRKHHYQHGNRQGKKVRANQHRGQKKLHQAKHQHGKQSFSGQHRQHRQYQSHNR